MQTLGNKEKSFNAAVFISLSTILATGVSFLQQVFIAKYLGAGIYTDAFFVARNVSDIFNKLLMTGQLTAIFAPIFMDYWVNKKEEVLELSASVMNFLLAASIVLAIIVAAFAPVIVNFTAPGFTPDTKVLTVKILRLLFPFNVLTMGSLIAIAILNSLKSFSIPAIAVLISNSVILIVFLFLVRKIGIYSLVVSNAVGVISSFILLMIFLLRKGMANQFKMVIHWRYISDILKLMVPFLFSTLAVEVGSLVYNRIATMQNPGDISALTYANRIFMLFINFIPVPLFTVIFPTIMYKLAQNDKEGLQKNVAEGIRLVVFVSVPIMILCSIFSYEIVNLMFERGKFQAHQTALVSTLLSIYMWGCIPHIVQNYFYRLCMTFKLTKLFSTVWIIGQVVSIGLYYLFTSMFGIKGLALSQTVSVLFLSFAFYIGLRSKNAIKQIFRDSIYIKIGICGLGMLFTGVFIQMYLMPKWGSLFLFVKIAALSGALLISFFIYSICAHFVKIKEAKMLLGIIQAKSTKISDFLSKY